MSSETSQPPMAWRLCGNQVKLWRTDADVSRDQLANEAGYDYEYVKSMELGRRRPTQRLLEVADEMCGARGKLLASLPYLQPEREPGRFQHFLDAEARAIAQYHYETVVIPGLLQTEEYVRALCKAKCPPVDDEFIEKTVASRQQRQERLNNPTVLFNFVLYEAALRTLVGGRETMRKQLLHLIDLSALRNVSIQVLLAEHGSHDWLEGPMSLLETDERETYAYSEGPGFQMLFAEREVVNDFSMRYGMLRSQALNTTDSVRYIQKLVEEL
ncbi:helix-turn-helix domain-containing protein [Streptomyces orinoci]|uniref:Helix-turn-helix transcriptional regulator n=1 Tax=Streptomyces orinoci TaxID=67339 RepID=A0ABV3K6Z8_STRON|nr:helix-turn-helix transcriptional regulator [Streptomyces orinoci]